jgi:hypothetical protein
MHRSRSIVVLGAIVALLPLLGFPSAWEAFFQVLAGLSIVGLSVWSQIDKKLSQKAKAQMRQMRKAPVAESESAPVMPAVTPDYGKRVTDFYPKTGQPGRRVSDLKPTLPPTPPVPPTSSTPTPAAPEEAREDVISEAGEDSI